MVLHDSTAPGPSSSGGVGGEGQAGRSDGGGMAGARGGVLPVNFDFPRQNSGVLPLKKISSGGVQFKIHLYNLWPMVILR